MSGDFKNKANYSETKDAEGNTTYSYQERSGLFGKMKDKSVTINAQGQIIADNTSGARNLKNGTQNTQNYGPITVKSIVDANGNEVKRDIRIIDKEIRKILRADGKINMQAANALRSTPGLDPKIAGEAMMMEVMRQRMPDMMNRVNILNNMADQGTVTNTPDGAITLTKVENDGTTHNFSMKIDQESGQVITTYERLEKPNKKGVRESTVMFSNGVVNSVDKRKLDANGNVVPKSEQQTRFAINNNYTRNHNRPPIDYQGRLASFMPKESVAFVGMSQEQIADIKKQFKEHPNNNNLEEFSKQKPRNLFTRLGNYLRNQGEVILTRDNEFVGLSEEEIEEIKRMRNEGYR